MKRILFWSVVWCALLSVLQAGSLRIELTVRDDVGMYRASEPVTSGIPIPIEQNIRNINGLRILTDKGAVIPAQFSVLARWNGLPTDERKPIQWVLVDFQADVAPGQFTKYYLVNNSDKPITDPMESIQTSEDRYAVTVNTGPMLLRISKEEPNLFDGVWLDVNGNGRFEPSEAIIGKGTSGDAVLTDLFGATYHMGSKKVEIEEDGPLRTVVKIEGRHLPTDERGLPIGFYDFLVRIHFFAGKSFIKVHYTLKNSPPCPVELGAGSDCPDPFFGSLAFKDFSLVTTLNLSEDRRYKVFGEKLYEGDSHRFRLYQDSSGGPNWNIYHTNWSYLLELAHNRNSEFWAIEGGPSFRGFKIYQDGQEIDSGNRAQGWVDVSDDRWGLTAQIRHFWQQNPKSTDLEGNKLTLGLWPKDYNGIHWLDDGMHKTHEVLYAFHLSDFNVERAVGSFNSPLLATASTRWYHDAKVIGPYGDLYEFNPEEVPAVIPLSRGGIGSRAALDNYRDFHNFWGWIAFGDIKPDPSSVGCPCMDPSTFNIFLQSFRRETFDVAEEVARQWMDIRIYHRDAVSNADYGGAMPDRSSYWLGTHRQGWLAPDQNHAWFSALYEYYLLTGNRKAIEAAHELAATIKRLGFWWHFTMDDQPFPYERAYGWMIYEFTRMYEVTGDINYLDDAEKVAKKAFDQTDKRRGNLLDAWMYTPGTAGPGTYGDGPRRHYDYGARTWQVGIALLGVGKYADVVLRNNIPRSGFSGEDARDFAFGLADLLVNEVFQPDVPIFPEDWFLTYPQPTAEELYPAGIYNTIEFEIIGGLSIVDKWMGKPEYHRAVEAMLRKWGPDRFDPYYQTGIINSNRKKTQAPEAIKDLIAQPGDDPGEIRLAWTAPEHESGGAYGYHIKYSDKPIVERINCAEIPCYEPCVINGYDSICPIDVGMTTFWAASRVEEAPTPRPGGRREHFSIKGLDPLKGYYIAIESEDADHNMSELSNVVYVP